MRLDDVRGRLSEHASGSWELVAYEDFARINATTPDSYGTASEAFAASQTLCAALLGGDLHDLHLRHQARLGARSSDETESPERWVGVVEIGVADPPPAPDIF